MPCHIVMKISFKNETELNAIFKTLEVETTQDDMRRGQITMMRKECDLILEIKAEDLVAARSLSNSILRLLKTSTEVADIISSDSQ